MIKKRSSEILADKNRKILLGKGQIGNVFHGVSNFFKTGWNSETGGKCIIASWGMDAPAHWNEKRSLAIADLISYSTCM